MGAAVFVDMLGGFSIRAEGAEGALTDAVCRSKKLLTLIEYLVVWRGRAVPLWELYGLLWPEGDADKSAAALKTLTHRARAALEDAGVDGAAIIVRGGAYQWNGELYTSLDADVFEAAARDALHSEGRGRTERLLKAASLYRGHFLPNGDGSVWRTALADYYRTLYSETVRAALSGLMGGERYAEALELSERAAGLLLRDETVYYYMLRALMALGRTSEARERYNSVSKTLIDEPGAPPSELLAGLYRDLARTDNGQELNLSTIRDELVERERAAGPFFCEYGFFKDMYRLKARAAARTGENIQLALLSISDARRLTAKQRNTVMERLREVITRSTRDSDVVCRYSATQYIFLLSNARVEDGGMVLARIRAAFRRAYPHMDAEFYISSIPMKPGE